MAVWLVSHCQTEVNREGYIKELQTYIDVKVIGKCSKSQDSECPKRDRNCRQKLFKGKAVETKYYWL